MKTLRQDFGGWSEFLAAVTRPMAAEVVGHGSSESNRKQFTWTDTYGEALRLAETGWAEGLRQIEPRTRAIEALNRHEGTLDSRYAEAGDEVDVGLYLADEPEAMIEYVLTARRHPVVRLKVSITASAVVPAEKIYHRGAAVVAAIDALEAEGVRCEVVAVNAINGDRCQFHVTIPVKRADEPLDRDRLAFALCHPSMLRRLCFRLHETESLADWRAKGASGYGHPADPAPEEGAVVVGCMRGSGAFGTLEAAAAESARLYESGMAMAG